jgi:hypothetical protein
MQMALQSKMNRVTRLLAGVGVCAFALAATLPLTNALALDRITLKDGTVIEGKIVKERGGFVWIMPAGGVKERMLMPDEVRDVAKNVDAASAPAPALATNAEPTPAVAATNPLAATNIVPETGIDGVDAAAPLRSGVPRGMVITCGDRENGDMVGVYMVAEVLQRAVPVIEEELGKEGDRIVALRIMSGGGYGMEVQLICDVLDYEYKSRWRTVGWIDSAISAAAMSAHILDEIYFTTQANYGACTGFYGSLDRPVEGFELEQALYQMEKISARAGYNPLIMRAMQIQQGLSASIDENGNVQYYNDASSGDIVVNRPMEILTFNAQSAARVKFSKGTADTLDELNKAMGYNEVEWVGKAVKNVPWPVSKAEKMQMDFRRKVKIDEDNTNRYFGNYQTVAGLAAQSQDRAQRAMLVGKARQALGQIDAMIRNNPTFARNLWGGRQEYKDWYSEQDRMLRELLR